MNFQPSISEQATAVRPESPIEAALSTTNVLIEELLGNTSELRSRLTPILMSEVPQAGKDSSAAPAPSAAALVGILESMAARIARANSELLDLRRRLAL